MNKLHFELRNEMKVNANDEYVNGGVEVCILCWKKSNCGCNLGDNEWQTDGFFTAPNNCDIDRTLVTNVS